MTTTTTMTLTTMTETTAATTADSPDPSDGDSSPAAVTRQTNVSDLKGDMQRFFTKLIKK